MEEKIRAGAASGVRRSLYFSSVGEAMALVGAEPQMVRSGTVGA